MDRMTSNETSAETGAALSLVVPRICPASERKPMEDLAERGSGPSSPIEVVAFFEDDAPDTMHICSMSKGSVRSKSVPRCENPSRLKNEGMDCCSGSYVLFADGCEELASAIEAIAAHAAVEESDLIALESMTSDAFPDVPSYRQGGLYKNPDDVQSPDVSLPTRLFRRSLLEETGLRFSEDYPDVADYLFASQFSGYARQTARIPVFRNEGPAARSRMLETCDPDNLVKAFQILVDFYQTRGVFGKVRPYLASSLKAVFEAIDRDEIGCSAREMADIYQCYFKNGFAQCEIDARIDRLESKTASSRKIHLDPDAPLFSVIIPVYNAEENLAETIESVLDQSIGAENIEIILINDGSADGSEEVCKRYADLHPACVKYYSQQNRGVSATRNRGMELATGRYIAFLDADDKWSEGAFEEGALFFQEHPDINLVSARMKFFGARRGNHPLNYKYSRTRVVDLKYQPNFPQLSLSSCFLRRSALGDRRFDEKLSIAEDMKLASDILFDEEKYGLISNAVYYYRKAIVSSSALDSSLTNRRYYFETPSLCHQYVLAKFSSKPHLRKFAMNVIMYDLQWRIKAKNPGFLNNCEFLEYQSLIEELLGQIDDDIIVSQKQLTNDYKILAFALKYSSSFSEMHQKMSYLHPLLFEWIDRFDKYAHFDFMKIVDGHVELEGEVAAPSLVRPYIITARIKYCGSNDTSEMFSECLEPRSTSLRDSYFEKGFFGPCGFSFSIPIHQGIESLELYCGKDKLVARFKKFVHLSNTLDASSFASKGWRVCFEQDRGILSVYSERSKEARAARSSFRKELLKTRGGRKSYVFHLASLLGRRLYAKRIWLISDRITAADDNGQALFEYLVDHPVEGVKPVFLISKDCPAFKKMKKIGTTVAYGGFAHKVLFLMSEKVISSAGEDAVLNAFGKNRDVMKCFYSFQYVFLQHGLTEKDQSKWLNRFNKNAQLIITTVPEEYSSFLSESYAYAKRNIIRTGMPRHDKLLHNAFNPEKKILVMPTWRNKLVGPYDTKTGTREKNPQFKSSDYFLFFDGLLHSEKLARTCREKGFTIDFVVHPSLIQEADSFVGNDVASVIPSPKSYAEAFRESSILVTDFSSVAFDFALLERPVIYAQFDEEDFFEGQVYDKGYFDYRDDGFGPVVNTLEDTVDAICSLMEKNGVIDEYYLDRIRRFFGPQPSCRCKAVVDAILETREWE